MSKQFWANLALCVVLGALVIFTAANFSKAVSPKGLLVTEPAPSSAAAALLPQVVLGQYQVGESPERVVQAVFDVQNKSDRDVKDIEVLCEFSTENGAYTDRKRWILPETVPAGRSLRLSQAGRQFVNTRSRAVNCKITDFAVAGKPFFTLERVAVAGHGAGHGSAPAGGHGHAAPAGH